MRKQIKSLKKNQGFIAGRDFSASLSFYHAIWYIHQQLELKDPGQDLRPSISFGYRPDFSDPKWGYFKEVISDTLGNTQRYSI